MTQEHRDNVLGMADTFYYLLVLFLVPIATALIYKIFIIGVNK
jgi:hypothetical protein